ncbi:hypothetical protein M409DRAFT_36679 [Zasmidium cellare ATCC 36951]|uniref:Major facilitator superfamily (MFS) profile domain-containing protein n=1 Tax=Zasmidium cellare ATCC 36951 TaxID=1080233 RepID=A0A6A6CLA8_ZASCE|nr:uncharacterized protein M409DRAFT_36679 [Zasmidium cellare ATCC 36951]KAF2166988.1 hypothetical protein M409DRAFT_36679 [Zasmidium cellare ATCC 36951]
MALVSDTKPDGEYVEDAHSYEDKAERSTFAQDPTESHLERKTKLKMDLFVLPLTLIVYFLASMGRSDLGNAQVAGMNKDLGITAAQYSNIGSLFYVGYLVFQLPSTLALRYLTPPVLVFLAMLLWGVATTCMTAATDYSSVAGLRFLIGVAEAGIQGMIFFLAIIYTPRELTKRLCFCYSGSALAGACNGLMAYGIVNNIAGRDGWTWQWIFLIEGVIPIGFSFIILVLYPSTPEKTRSIFFSADEKAFLIGRSRLAANTGEYKFRPKLFLSLFADPVFWLLTVMCIGGTFTIATLQNFLPAIIRGFGWSATTAQAMSVVPYAIAFVTTNFWAQLADRFNQRGFIIVANMLLAIVGFIVLLTVYDRVPSLIGCCVLVAGAYPATAIGIAYIPTLLPGRKFFYFPRVTNL